MSRIKGLSIKRIVQLRLSARDWQLYVVKGAPTAAVLMNRAVEAAVNAEGSTRSTARIAIAEEWRAFNNFGAMDTVPRDVLEQILDEVYGEQS